MTERSELLSALHPDDLAVLRPHMMLAKLDAGTVIYEPGANVEWCYFPLGGTLCSYFVLLDSGIAVETIMVGREGALGGIVSHGSLPAFARSNVLHGGEAFRIAVRDLEAIKLSRPSIAHLFNRYADCVMAQVFQSIACNAVHTIEERAAKWLVAAVDRIGCNQVTMTQEQLASMMGIGRSYASRVLQRFKADRLVRTRRGGIEVMDREALAGRACSCNEQVAEHFHKVLGAVYPAEV